MFYFDDVVAVPEDLIEQSKIQNAMLFEIAMALAEKLLLGEEDPDWDSCFAVAAKRQDVHYDAKIPEHIGGTEKLVAAHASRNLVCMLRSIQHQNSDEEIKIRPYIPGLGWIANGNGDFALGPMLVEVKHTDRNFVANDYRQVLMYWLLRYAACLEFEKDVWRECMLINPRRNAAVLFNTDYVLRSASASANRVELYELLRSIVIWEDERI